MTVPARRASRTCGEGDVAAELGGCGGCAPPGASPSPRDVRLLELASADLEMRWPVPCFAAALNPVGDPFEHFFDGCRRRAEEVAGQVGVAEECGCGLGAGELGPS